MTREVIADIHNHSTASDGEYSPAELVAQAKELGLSAIGITDHDTLAGIAEAIQTGTEIGIEVIPGVEVSLAFKRSYFVGTLHLLFYFPFRLLRDEHFNHRLLAILSQGRGLALVQKRVAVINNEFGPQGKNPVLKQPLTVEQVNRYGSNITRRHFNRAFQEIHDIQDRNHILMILGNDSPAYVPSGIEMNLLRPFFHDFPVLRVFAHPAAGSFPGDSHYKEVLPPLEIVEHIFPEFLELGIDGIEVHYPGHTFEHRELLLTWAEKYNLLITGGSDCHDRIHRPLGAEGMTSDEVKRFREKLETIK